MGLNKLLEHGFQSSVQLSLNMVFQAVFFYTTLFLKRSGHGITILLLYVDDMIITGDDMQGIQNLKHFLGHEFETKDLDPLNYFLGLEVSSSADGYYLIQAKYTSNLISRASITDSVATPELGLTRMASPNRNPGTLGLFLFIFHVIKFFFSKYVTTQIPGPT